MLAISDLIQGKSLAWAMRERENTASAVGSILCHIDGVGHLREPQIRAIEVYLWLKFVGSCRRLADLVIDGKLADNEFTAQYNLRNSAGHLIYSSAQEFLLWFAAENNLHQLRDKIRDNPGAAKIWEKAVRDLLHNFDYPNYFFSLPMGAGKTYLMASFICLDLHFSRIIGGDSFARNFAVFAPHAAKTAILPALRTIKEFDPEWVLPSSSAAEVRREMRVEILDKPASNAKNLRTNNPNLERVNRLVQRHSRGLVFITNAEKVVLERYANNDAFLQSMGAKEKSEAQKTNELRAALSGIPALGVMLDEGVHAYSPKGEPDKKLRDAVYVFQRGGNLRFVLGFSGTPYVSSKIEMGGVTVNLNRLQDVVYDFPLALGLGVFLKTPIVKSSSGVREAAFIADALGEFFKHHDKEYESGAKSKIAFYCPSIAVLNQKILPAVKSYYAKHRRKCEGEEILAYYTASGVDAKKYSLPKSALADFHNLDEPHSQYRVVLLVAVGKEGWDCKSLTAVALPRKTTTRNFVLQTSCRCLREIDDAKKENALICLGDGNYNILAEQLEQNHQMTIDEFGRAAERDVPVIVRKPKLGKLRYRQVYRRVKIVARRAIGNADSRLGKFKFADFKKRNDYNLPKITAEITQRGTLREKSRDSQDAAASANGEFPLSSYWRFAAELSQACFGVHSAAELEMKHGKLLAKIHAGLIRNADWFALASRQREDIWLDAVREVAACLADEDEYHSEYITKNADIELLEWKSTNPTIPHGKDMLPTSSESELQKYRQFPRRLDEDIGGVDPADISFNYAPYRFDSALEKNALTAVLHEAEAQNFEFYYNGMRRSDDELESFYIETPQGRYTPDFLLIKRSGGRYRRQVDGTPDSAAGAIEKILIVETKAALYYNDNFRDKEKFVKENFLRYNPHICYHCVVDESGKNDFSVHLGNFRRTVRQWAGIPE